MLFANASLARRIERAETGLILEGARAAARRVPPQQLVRTEMNGGAAVFVEPGAPFNKIVGLGFAGTPSDDILEQVERAFAKREAPLQAEVSTLADPEVFKTLARRGYELVGFENVLGFEISSATIAQLRSPSADIEISTAEETDTPLWFDTVITGFMHPDTFDGPAGHESIPRDVLERVFGDTVAANGFVRFLARRGGAVAGGASFRVQDGVAQLSGAATLPQHRRHGIQSALLRHRLLEATRQGCDIAVVTTQPGSKSQENAQKSGFVLLYARAVMVKPQKG
jgi:ribosomal protein S18 acetylase RimI-like enzyme